jgi:hypothetical protein
MSFLLGFIGVVVIDDVVVKAGASVVLIVVAIGVVGVVVLEEITLVFVDVVLGERALYIFIYFFQFYFKV